MQEVGLHKSHGDWDDKEGVEAAHEEEQLGVDPQLEEGKEEKDCEEQNWNMEH